MNFMKAGNMGDQTSEEVSELVLSGVTRREALRKGTLLGAGAVWAAPAVRSLTMSQNFAAATSPLVDSEEEEVNPQEPETEPNPPGENPPDETVVEGEEVNDNPKTSNPPDEVRGVQVTRPGANQAQVQAGELPLTGIEATDAAVLGAGLVAAGAALLKATKPDPDSQS